MDLASNACNASSGDNYDSKTCLPLVNQTIDSNDSNDQTIPKFNCYEALIDIQLQSCITLLVLSELASDSVPFLSQYRCLTSKSCVYCCLYEISVWDCHKRGDIILLESCYYACLIIAWLSLLLLLLLSDALQWAQVLYYHEIRWEKCSENILPDEKYLPDLCS